MRAGDILYEVDSKIVLRSPLSNVSASLLGPNGRSLTHVYRVPKVMPVEPLKLYLCSPLSNVSASLFGPNGRSLTHVYRVPVILSAEP